MLAPAPRRETAGIATDPAFPELVAPFHLGGARIPRAGRKALGEFPFGPGFKTMRGSAFSMRGVTMRPIIGSRTVLTITPLEPALVGAPTAILAAMRPAITIETAIAIIFSGPTGHPAAIGLNARPELVGAGFTIGKLTPGVSLLNKLGESLVRGTTTVALVVASEVRTPAAAPVSIATVAAIVAVAIGAATVSAIPPFHGTTRLTGIVPGLHSSAELGFGAVGGEPIAGAGFRPGPAFGGGLGGASFAIARMSISTIRPRWASVRFRLVFRARAEVSTTTGMVVLVTPARGERGPLRLGRVGTEIRLLTGAAEAEIVLHRFEGEVGLEVAVARRRLEDRLVGREHRR
jgi:hypothetical protein